MEHNDISNHDEVLGGYYGDSSGGNNVYRSSSSSSATPPHYAGYSSPQLPYNIYDDPTTTVDYEDSWMPQPSSPSWVMIALQWLEAVTHPNLGMLVATLLIIVAIYQFVHQHNRQLQQVLQQQQHRDWRSVVWQWLDQLRERDWLEWLQVQCVLLWDYAHFYSQMGMEMLRSLRLYWDTNILSSTVMTSEPWEDAQDHRQRNIHYRRGGNFQQQPSQQSFHQQQQQHQTQQKRNGAAGGSAWPDLPELEDVVEYDHRVLRHQSGTNDVEPAFLNPDDYPPGWLVYHAILGVVTKTEADQYQLQMQQLQQQQDAGRQQQQVQQEESIPTSSLSPYSFTARKIDSNHHDQNGSFNDNRADKEFKKHAPMVIPSVTANG